MNNLDTGTFQKRILAKLVDFSLVTLFTVVLFFACFMPIFKSTTNYNNSQELIQAKVEYYRLNISAQTPNYEPYKDVIEDIFFNKLYNEIYEISNKDKEEKVSVEYLYNVNYLLLPSNPDSTNYSTDFFEYQRDENNQPIVDKVGVLRKDNNLNINGLHSLFDLYSNSFEKLKRLVLTFDEEYGNAYRDVIYLEQTSVISSFSISCFIFLILIPLLNKKRQGIGFMIMNLGLYKQNKFSQLPIWRTALYPMPYIIIFGIGVYLLNVYSICLLIVAPIFVDLLAMIYGKKNSDFGNFISHSVTLDLRQEENPDEITDPEYLAKLENLVSMEGANND